MIIVLLLPKKPTATAQQKGVNTRGASPHFYTKKSVEAVKTMYKLAILDYFRKSKEPIPYFNGPVSVSVRFDFAMTDKRTWGRYKTTKPDCDNLVKLLLDVLTGLHFWRDDAVVASLKVEKFYSNQNSVVIKVEDLK